MSGHVFITHGDLTRLACHAWLLPPDAAGSVTEGWLDSDARLSAWVQQEPDGGRHILRAAHSLLELAQASWGDSPGMSLS